MLFVGCHKLDTLAYVNNDIGKFTSNLSCHSVTSVNKSEMSSATTSDSCSTTEKRERKTNFNYHELRVILDLFKTNASIVNGKFAPSVTQKGKNKIWNSIAVATSACGYAARSPHEVKKKWSDMKRTSIKIASEMKHPKTGGGSATFRPWYVDTVLDILGEETALVHGIDGKYY